MINLHLRSLIKGCLAAALVAIFLSGILGAMNFRQKTAATMSNQVVSTLEETVSLDQPEIQVTKVDVASTTDDWHVALAVPDTQVQAAIDRRYPGFHERFPDGVALEVIDQLLAPEALRGPYDDENRALVLGAVAPQPQPGQSVKPEMEAWAGCRRDLELGPARQLRCYLFVRGEPGQTLNGLAVLAWVQALDVAFSGRLQPLFPDSLPFLTITEEGDLWTYDDAYLSLSPLP